MWTIPDLILVWGTDPSKNDAAGNASERLRHRLRMKERKLLSLDPRRTKAAELKAASGFPSAWIRWGPGPGLSHILIREDLFDAEFVRDWTVGFEEFAAHAEEFTPEYVASVTGIDVDRIEELAEQIADAEGATYIMYTGLNILRAGSRTSGRSWCCTGRTTGCGRGGRCFLHRENGIP
ncbi:MAG: molybdopterin-dependent oxidoreductase [Desulfobacterales bacterium]